MAEYSGCGSSKTTRTKNFTTEFFSEAKRKMKRSASDASTVILCKVFPLLLLRSHDICPKYEMERTDVVKICVGGCCCNIQTSNTNKRFDFFIFLFAELPLRSTLFRFSFPPNRYYSIYTRKTHGIKLLRMLKVFVCVPRPIRPTCTNFDSIHRWKWEVKRQRVRMWCLMPFLSSSDTSLMFMAFKIQRNKICTLHSCICMSYVCVWKCAFGHDIALELFTLHNNFHTDVRFNYWLQATPRRQVQTQNANFRKCEQLQDT